MRISSNVLKSTLVLAASISLFSCNKKDDNNPTTPSSSTSGNILVSQNISSNTTWSAGNIYELGGRITVVDGATLTIEPGTIIKGQAGTGANATALLIARGGKLMAEGTETKPIIFTSVADEITIADVNNGNFKSPNLSSDHNGLWGGILVCGKATISAANATEAQIEGIPTSDANGLYGGTNDADNSGSMKFISIRHGGTNIGSGNEINGLTLAGVGSGTVIENIEVVGNQDDGIEWFGGSVNVKNVLVWNNGDDAIDTDQSWGGTLDNFVIVTPGDRCFELDGPEGNYEASHTIKNGTVLASYAGKDAKELINTDKNSMVSLENIFFAAVADGQVVNRTTDNPGVTYSNIVINGSKPVADYIEDADSKDGISVAPSSGNKANAAAFANWTWAAQEGVTNGL